MSFRGVEIKGSLERPSYKRILSADFLEFLAALHRNFNKCRLDLLAQRDARQKEFDSGALPNFLKETEYIRTSGWRAAPIPADLRDRRVEITGPVDRKMVINALNSGACVFMADFEDSTAPTWPNIVDGAVNLYDAVRRTISITSGGKSYALKKEGVAVLFVRPRGWHLCEAHILIDGSVTSASLFDFALHFYHNAVELVKRGSGPYFYLPKMESHREARLWNDVFVFSQNYVGLPRGTVRATVLIETILAAYEMDEIIYELREHSSGLNCGRWDYIFSFIKKFRNNKDFLLPDRAQVTMESPWMANYVKLLIQTCHKRGVHAMGGMAAQIPVKNDEKANQEALDKVRKDKLMEVKRGHDGTWVAHPALVSIAREIFDKNMPTPNQIDSPLSGESITAKDLIDLGPRGTISENGVKANISIGLRYLEAWLRGVGCVPIYNLMEDAATAEISRVQLWQWIHHGATMTSGAKVTQKHVFHVIDEDLKGLKESLGEEEFKKRKFSLAAKIYKDGLSARVLEDFLTLPAYEHITSFVDNRGSSHGEKGHVFSKL